MISAFDKLEVFDKNFIPDGKLVSAYEETRRRRINSDYEMSFLVPMISEDYREKIQLKGHVQDERGQFYVIQSRSRVRDGRKLTASIYCTHVMFKLMDYKFPYASYIDEDYGVHISQLTDLISAATGRRFTFSIDDTFDLVDVKDFGQGNCLVVLNKVVELYGCEIDPNNFVVHLKKRIGTDNGHQYRLKKNIVSDQFKDDVSSLVTRMFAQMKDGTTWIGQPASILTGEERTLLEAVPGAIIDGVLKVNYLISPYVHAWSSDSVPFFDNEIIVQDIDPAIDEEKAVQALLEATRKALREQEIPAFEVTVDGADLYKIDGEETKPELGDTVYCHDPDMEMVNLSARITELTEYPYSMDKHAQATVANVMRRDERDIQSDLEKSKNTVQNLFSGGRIRAAAFEEFAHSAVIDINNSKTEIKYESRGIVLEEKDDPLRQMVLSSKGLFITTDGGATARLAATADGFAAEVIRGQFGNFVSMLIGEGNNVVQINTHGMAAGHANFNEAPFRVDMLGNVNANKFTAKYASISDSNFKDGAIVGSSINVGSGRFTVSPSGDVYAEGGVFAGGRIVGSKYQTSETQWPRVVIDPSSVAFGVYADENNGIMIPAYADGVSKIIFLENGHESNFYNSPTAGLVMTSYGNATISGSNVILSPSGGVITVPEWNKLFNNLTGLTLASELSNLNSSINAIWSYLASEPWN
ncbi:phage tail protein [Paenibacillus sp. FSL L8-0463]|uniref:phage tail protein n=1 Tax=Paenibacillus sp. FSL L8-0463 TaxID=2954687 RepID=UPI00311A432F